MPDQLQLRGGTTAEHSTFTGAIKEVTVDTSKKTVVVHDGTTAGGIALLRQDGSNSALALGSAGTPSLKWDANTGIYSPGEDQLAVATNGTGRLFIDASGNVGVGVTPSELLHVNGNALVEDRLLLQRLQSSDNLSVLTFSDTLTGSKGNNLSFGNPGGFDLLFHAGGSEQMRLTSTGLAIEDRLSLQRLQSSDNLSVLTFSDTLTGSKGNNLSFGNAGGFDLLFHTGGSEKMRLTSTGLAIGTTSPSSLLHLADAGNITVGTTTGTKIGTATTQKLGFYNATPVVQPTAVADATTAVDVITQLNALLAKLRTLGIIAT